MKRTIILLLATVSTALSYAGNISFDFPAFHDQPLKLYYFKGNRIDSLSVTLNAAGRGELNLPDYLGMVQLYIKDGGASEFIAGEPGLKVVCKKDVINKETVSFPGSKENEFLYSAFGRKSQLLGQQGWLQAGKQLFPDNQEMLSVTDKELNKVIGEMALLDDSIKYSSLYAAKFLQWLDFMNRLSEAEQQRDSVKAGLVRNEMETTADIDALYTSGQLWGSVHNFYISMFNRIDTPNKQEEYAASINRIIDRIDAGMKENFLSGSIFECERFGWGKPEELMIQHFVTHYPDITFKDSNLQRMAGMLRTMNDKKAPALAGVVPSDASLSSSLLIFYESGCNSCDIQISEIKKHYDRLQSKGIRIISISADHEKNVFEYYVKGFPWADKDKLCDYQGFEGDNFKNYGVVATPTIFVIDGNGNIQGRFATLQDTGLLGDE